LREDIGGEVPAQAQKAGPRRIPGLLFSGFAPVSVVVIEPGAARSALEAFARYGLGPGRLITERLAALNSPSRIGR